MIIENEKIESRDDFEIVNTVRYIAIRLLSRYERSDSYIDKLLAYELKNNDLIPADKALLTEIVNGVIRFKQRLDWVLTGFYFGDFQKCLNIVKNAMRVALYQITFLDKIPIPAAINESVEVVKRIQGDKTAGIVNGVLRNIVRNFDNVRYPDRNDDLVYYFSIIYSHPKWMVKRFLEIFGEEASEQLLMLNNEKPSITVRVNRLKSSPDEITSIFSEHGVEHYQSPYLKESIALPRFRNDISVSGIYKNGLIAVQDTSASLATLLANPAEGQLVVDLCAAPGGKSFLLAELMNDKGLVLAVDKYQSKLRFIEEGAERLGLTIVKPVVDDARTLKLDTPADIVFADVPCSGLGTLSKKPDIKWKRDIDDIPILVYTQRQILSNAARYVRSGGVIVYSTCTIEPEENEKNIEWFLKNFPEFQVDPAYNYLPAEVCNDGFMQTLPHIHHTDGAFAARLVKNG